jgi:hypothetical protein
MESERKMKLTKLAKNLLAVSALTVASFGANAGAIATADLDVFDFGLFNVADNTPFLGATVISSNFLGTTTASDANSTIFSAADNDTGLLGYDNFTISASSANSSSYVTFAEAHDAVGALGTTYATSTVNGNTTAQATSNLENTAVFTVDDGDAGTTGASMDFGFSFSWAYDLVAEIFGQGGTAQSSVNVSMNLKDSAGQLVTLFFTEDMAADPLFGGFSATSVGKEADTLDRFGNASDSGMEVRYLSLVEGEQYTLFVQQNSEVDVTSVAEPTSVAILGLGLLGLAGVSRRRKS